MLGKEINLNNMIVICLLAKMISLVLEYVMEKYVLKERLMIAEKITHYVDELYKNETTHEWKSKNPDGAQKDSLEEIFYQYDSITSVLNYGITTLTDTLR